MGSEIIRFNFKIPGIAAFQTTVHGGVSQGAYQSLNLGLNSGDDPGLVLRNRKILEQNFKLKSVCYMHQVHGSLVCEVNEPDALECDGIVTTAQDLPLAVLTADCLPVLLATEDGTAIAAVHCGWRSLQGRIIKHAAQRLRARSNKRIKAVFGACIGPHSYEVDDALKDKFAPDYAKAFLKGAREGHYQFDLKAAAKIDLNREGIELVDDCAADTFSDPGFYSYRRSKSTGRMACVIVKLSS